ncbi:hypothetical protein TCON_1834 [Astathelohania contejeani]|uniref:Uncharacterized protein n=1 Tax=Astathelohania contejeani TaxID=164912 RepID=A0ABQ7HXS1_9MICR|nr:hypothetical protein TCON_1834 [Thelohania contejeani]
MEISLTLIDQMVNLLISLVSMQFMKRIDVNDTKLIRSFRMVYLLSQVAYILGLFIVNVKIKAVRDSRTLKVPKEKKFFSGDEEDDEDEEITYTDYDLREFNRMIKSFITQMVFVCFLHWKWGFLQPLMVQILTVIKSFFLNPLFLAYILDKEIIRPFENNIFFQSITREDDELARRRRRKDD